MNLKLLKYNVMVRKIKFRGKDIDTGEWRYGYLSFFYTAGRDKNGFILTDKAQIYSQEDGRCYDVLAETVGQLTGKTDKNRKEIYEHDLLQDEEGVIYEIWYSEENACFMAEMVNPQNDMVDILGGYDTERCFEIVGNKFDNPNL